MKILLKSVKIIDKSSAFNNKIQDILIIDGVISKINSSINEEADKTIEGENLHVSKGWVDIKASFREPGEEWKETLESGILAAKKGGFTDVAITSDTKNPIDNRSQIEFILNRTKNKPVNILPYGALSQQNKGTDLAEIGDMHEAGAIGFSDNKGYANAGLLSRALLYTKTFNTKVFITPYEKSISPKGVMHEGITSTKMGISGIPALAEKIQLLRDIELAKYQDSPIHFHTISTKGAVDIIRKAKKEGVKVTCDIAAHQLYFKDTDLTNYESNLKVIPPFREQKDIDALIEGLKDGTIDTICSDHSPQDIEAKKLEFEHADFGIISLESFFGVVNSVLSSKIELEDFIELITDNARKIIGIAPSEIKENNKVNLTVFNPDKKWIFSENDIKSLSKNTPFIGKELKGIAIETLINE